MKPRLLNRICAYPEMLAWILGALAVNGMTLLIVSSGAPLSVLLMDPEFVLPFAFAVIPLSLLGWFVGMFPIWNHVRRACSHYNAGSLKVGDEVMVLAGRHAGIVANVSEIRLGQGLWEVAQLDLGEDLGEEKPYGITFEHYSLLKLNKGEQSSAPDHSHGCTF